MASRRILRLLMSLLVFLPVATESAQGASLGLTLVNEGVFHEFTDSWWDCMAACPSFTLRDPAEAGIGTNAFGRVSDNTYTAHMIANAYTGLYANFWEVWKQNAVASARDSWSFFIVLEVTGDPGAQGSVTFDYEFDLRYTLLLLAPGPGYAQVEGVPRLGATINPPGRYGKEEMVYGVRFSEKAEWADFDVDDVYSESGSKTLSNLVTVGDTIELFGYLDVRAKSDLNPWGESIATHVGVADFTMTVTPVPEPSTLVLCGGGLVLLAVTRQRRWS